MDNNSGAHAAEADRAAAANYVSELSVELAKIARRHGLDTLAFILDMACLEAENVNRTDDVQR